MSADSLHARMERWLGTYADDVHRVGYEELVAIWRDATALIATQSDHFADASNMAQGAVNAITFFRCPKCDHYYRVRVTECDCEPGARTFEPITMVPQTPAPQRHPDALEDGSLSKSTAKRVDALLMAQGECHNPCTPIDFFNGNACEACVTAHYSPTTQPPHQDRGEVVGVRDQARKIITDTIGFEFGTDTLQPVNDHDMLYLAEAFGRALTEAKQQGPGEAGSPSLKQTPAWWVGYSIGHTGRAPYHCIGPDKPPSQYANDSVHWTPLYTAPQVEAKRQTGEVITSGNVEWWILHMPGWPGGISFSTQEQAIEHLSMFRRTDETHLARWVHQANRHDYSPEETRAMIAAAAKPSGSET